MYLIGYSRLFRTGKRWSLYNIVEIQIPNWFKYVGYLVLSEWERVIVLSIRSFRVNYFIHCDSASLCFCYMGIGQTMWNNGSNRRSKDSETKYFLIVTMKSILCFAKHHDTWCYFDVLFLGEWGCCGGYNPFFACKIVQKGYIW